MSRILERRSALVIAIGVLALAVATSSTVAYAAAVARNSVLSRSIKNGEVKAPDIAPGAVRSGKIADGSVDGVDLREGAVGAQHLALMQTYFNTSAATGDADGTTNGGDFGKVAVTASCPAGWMPISGGAQWVEPSIGDANEKNLYLHSSVITSTGWYARGIIDTGAQGNVKLRVFVRCLPPWPSPQS